VEGGKLLANIKLDHGYFASSMLPNQYERLWDAAGIGQLGDAHLDEQKTSYSSIVSESARQSQDAVLLQEIAMSSASDIDDGISIMSDARHCWRKNAKFTDVVFLGDLTHKVIRLETVTRSDDTCSQHHEMIGVERFYNYMEVQQCPVIYHAHDNNASVVKFIREKTDAENCLDTWHMTKSLAKSTKKITCGTKKMSGILWHPELSDKAASIKTHI
jgi:hypothetical protein